MKKRKEKTLWIKNCNIKLISDVLSDNLSCRALKFKEKMKVETRERKKGTNWPINRKVGKVKGKEKPTPRRDDIRGPRDGDG